MHENNYQQLYNTIFDADLFINNVNNFSVPVNSILLTMDV